MSAETKTYEDKMTGVINHLVKEHATIRAGRANPAILDKVTVDYYGTPTPINQVGNLSVSDARCLVIAPWDTSMLKVIEKQLLAENIGITPSNDGKVIRLVFPQLTEERRKELVKQVKKMAEDAKVAVRNVRRDCMDDFKKMKNAKEISEDEAADAEKETEKIVTKTIAAIDAAAAEKEKDVLAVSASSWTATADGRNSETKSVPTDIRRVRKTCRRSPSTRFRAVWRL